MHNLVSACPQPQHASAYAVVIRAEYARRTIHHHAEQLARAATDTTVPERPRHTLTAADDLARHLDQLAGRFPSHARPLPRTPHPPAPDRQRETRGGRPNSGCSQARSPGQSS